MSVTDRDDALMMAVTGEIDGLTAGRLRSALAEAFAGLGRRVLVLDLTAVGFLGSPGLRTLLDGAREAARRPGYRTLRVVVDSNRPVIMPIQIAGLDNVLSLHDSVSDALAGGDIQ